MALSEETIKRRLKGINSTQDSIQTTSLWVLHHKDNFIDKIARCWMEVFKQADDNLRISLIYVMNDVVQKANKKEDPSMVKQAFHPHVVNAFAMASKVVKKPILRCVQVFEERRVFDSHIIDEMKAALGTKKPAEEPDDGLAEIDHTSLMHDIESFYQNEEIIEKARNILSRSDLNFKEKMQENMKDRIGGTKIITEMDSSKNKLNLFLSSVERHQAKCQRMVDLLKAAKTSLNLQLRDVTVVDDAYEKFATGIKDTKRELDESFKTGIFPGMSPPRDAPSPEADADPFAQAFGHGSSEDMDMDEDDGVPGESSSMMMQPRAPPVPVIPISSALDPRLQRLLNQKQGNMDPRNLPSPIAIDPRQASRPPFPKPHPEHSPMRHTNPNPGFFSPTTAMGSMHLQIGIGIDTSHPPPPFFPGGSNPISPSSPAIFNPKNPPPFGYIPSPEGMQHPPPPHMIPPPGRMPKGHPPPQAGPSRIPNYALPPPGFISNPPPPEDMRQPTFTPMVTAPFNVNMPPPQQQMAGRNGTPQKRRHSDTQGNGTDEDSSGNNFQAPREGRRSFTHDKRPNWNNNKRSGGNFDGKQDRPARGFLFD